MENIRKIVLSIVIGVFFVACGGSSSGNNGDNNRNSQVDTKPRLSVKTIEIK